MSYKQKFEQDLQSFLHTKNLNFPVIVNYSGFQDFQYQSPLPFVLTKAMPDFDKTEIISYLKNHAPDTYEDIQITGNGFLSVKLKLFDMKPVKKESKKVLVDYCGVNVAKQMHIGHIRSMFIGDFVVRLHETIHDNASPINHIGDWGNQFGFLLNYIRINNLEHTLDNKSLTQYYKEAYEKSQQDEVFAQETTKIAYALQNNLDPALHALWEKLVNISLSEAEKTFEELNLKMNLSHTRGESFYAPFCANVIQDLLSKKIASPGEDGSVVVFFEDKSPLVLQKSNGNFLYALYDLAAIQWRVENLQPEKIVYVVDKRQSLHFEQVFEVAQKAGYAKNTELVHIGFGTILGKDKKPLKTKEGKSLYLDKLMAQGKEIVLQSEHFQSLEESHKEEILNKTIVGGMKYYDLKFNKNQDYVFDWSHVLNFSGSSAPYVQNAIVRIDSIFFKKFGMLTPDTQDLDFNYAWNALEREIIFNCQKTYELLDELSDSYASQTLTTHMQKLCQLFHKYYEQDKILGSQTEDKKLQLLDFISKSLQTSCDILGIETYMCEQRMALIQPKSGKVKP